jgi:hypothetical protein
MFNLSLELHIKISSFYHGIGSSSEGGALTDKSAFLRIFLFLEPLEAATGLHISDTTEFNLVVRGL